MSSTRPRSSRRAVLLGALACALGGCGTEQPPASPAHAPGVEVADRVTSLEEQLEQERARSAELEAQLRWTQTQLRELAIASGAGPPPPATAQEPRDPAPGEERQRADAAPGKQREFDAAGLTERGLAVHEVERIQTAFDRAQLQRLELEHTATRDGWLRRPRYRKAQAAIEARLRRELGDDDYDVLLYGSGRKNRVAVSSVLPGSVAAKAGLEPRDVIQRYDDQYVFSGAALRRYVTSGTLGGTVQLDILRDGVPLRLGVPRGPLGIRLEPRRVLPERLR